MGGVILSGRNKTIKWNKTTAKDWLGMPKMNFKFQYTEGDKKAIAKAMQIQAQAAAALGKVLKEGEQTLMPTGNVLALRRHNPHG